VTRLDASCATPRVPVGARAVAILLAMVLVAGCVSQGGQLPVGTAAPELELLEAGRLDIPGDCRPRAGAVYRASFTVMPDGRVTGVEPEPGPRCVREALSRWVNGFRYRPLPEPASATIDWMAVEARRGS
jgi:hypothetical protein